MKVKLNCFNKDVDICTALMVLSTQEGNEEDKRYLMMAAAECITNYRKILAESLDKEVELLDEKIWKYGDFS